MFRFQIGAIKRSKRLLLSMSSSTFRFQIGAIKSLFPYLSNILFDTRFDSKLVRLKDQLHPVRCNGIRMFRFQIGAIKSPDETPNFSNMHVGFDSKLVRLKANRVTTGLVGMLLRFRFQIGAIKRLGSSVHLCHL